MDFFMQWSKSIASALAFATLAACAAGGASAPLRIRSAEIDGAVLTTHLNWQPSTIVLDALDNGIVLDFAFELRAYGAAHFGWRRTLAQAERHVELRYFPLSRRYQLRDLDRGETRSYAARSLLVGALEELRLDLPADWAAAGARGFALRVELDRERLPGALRLPALLSADWQMSGEFSWPVAGAG